MDIDSFIQLVDKKSPPARESDVQRLEAELGCELPPDYRDFLVRCNGGYIGGRLWYHGPTPDGKPAEAGIHHIGGFRSESYFSLMSHRAVYDGRIPASLLWIMDDPFGNAICLGLAGPTRGQVFFWDHELEPDPDEWDGAVDTAGNVTLIAHSFTEFVAGLRALTDEDDA